MQFFKILLEITSLKCRPLLMTQSRSRSRKLSMALPVIAGGMVATSCRIASFNCSIVPGRRERLQEFVINNGRHLSDVIFKSV